MTRMLDGKLLVDLGNTRLKWGLSLDGKLRPGGVFGHRDRPLAEALRLDWASLARPAVVRVASVAGETQEQALAEVVDDLFGVAPDFVRSPRAGLGIRNGYVAPSRLGVDRFLALAALHAQAARAQVLVSVGTAMTLDALSADGTHLGGLIAPTPDLARRAVLAATAQVRESVGQLVELADNTADGVFSGALLGAVSLIERFQRTAAARLGTDPVVVLAGGGMDEIAALLPAAERRHDLVLRGLALWGESP